MVSSFKFPVQRFFIQPINELNKNSSFIKRLSEGNNSLWRLIFGTLVVFFFFFFPYISLDYGITMDETLDHSYFERVWNYYKTFGEDKSCLDQALVRDLVYYGPFANLLAVIAAKYFSPFGLYETRHIVSSLFGFTGLLFTGLLARKIANWRTACLAVTFLFFSPVYFG